MRHTDSLHDIQLLPVLWSAHRSDHLGDIASEDKTMMKQIVAVFGIALGVSTAGSEMMLVPIIAMGIGLLALSEVAEW